MPRARARSQNARISRVACMLSLCRRVIAMKHVARVTSAAVLLAYAVGCGGKTEPIPSPTPVSPTNPTPSPLPPYSPDPPTDNPPEPPTPVTPPTPAPTNPTKPLPPNTCLSLLSDTYFHGAAESIASIDLSTGVTTVETRLQKSVFSVSVSDISSLGLYGSDVLVCQGRTTIVKISRIDGSTSAVATRACEAVTADEQGIYVINGGGKIVRYPDLASLASGSPSTEIATRHATRLGPSKNGLLAAWHATTWIFMGNDYFTFEDYDDANYGVSGASGGRIVISSVRADGTSPGLVMFDAKGKRLGNVMLPKPAGDAPGSIMGLTCAY